MTLVLVVSRGHTLVTSTSNENLHVSTFRAPKHPRVKSLQAHATDVPVFPTLSFNESCYEKQLLETNPNPKPNEAVSGKSATGTQTPASSPSIEPHSLHRPTRVLISAVAYTVGPPLYRVIIIFLSASHQQFWLPEKDLVFNGRKIQESWNPKQILFNQTNAEREKVHE
ncbi:hypothetical protein MRB53_029518 [Persea americana]|uniref:Uncharacterized protein n=1 Tax=Persea americana TaxID=3435 RepID=A0ACC2KIL5_PERAE|nr:hypothetical protein MRB53_029518 [Persea americana]